MLIAVHIYTVVPILVKVSAVKKGDTKCLDYRSMACDLNILLKVCGDKEKGGGLQDRSSFYLLLIRHDFWNLLLLLQLTLLNMALSRDSKVIEWNSSKLVSPYVVNNEAFTPTQGIFHGI